MMARGGAGRMLGISYRELCDPEDRGLVAAFYQQAADYIELETGSLPTDATVEAFFTGAEDGHDCAADLREGLFRDGALVGIAELAFDLPEPQAATITLMVLAKDARGQGLGSAWARRLAHIAAAHQARIICLSVLGRNPKARAFWERAGFRYHATTPPRWCGSRLQTRHQMRLNLAPLRPIAKDLDLSSPFSARG